MNKEIMGGIGVMTEGAAFQVPPDLEAEIDELITHYPAKPNASPGNA